MTDETVAQTESTKSEAYIYVSRIAYGDEDVTTEPLKVPNFQGVPVARVTTGASITKNLGNYESAKVTVEVSLPCFPTDEEVVRAYANASVLVAEMVQEQVDSLTK